MMYIMANSRVCEKLFQDFRTHPFGHTSEMGH